MGMNRREFVRTGAISGAGLAVAAGAAIRGRVGTEVRDPVGETTARELDTLDRVQPRTDEDVLLRMQRELVKAMAKPVEQRRW